MHPNSEPAAMDMSPEITDLPGAIREARALSALGRPDEGYEVLDLALAWAEGADPPEEEDFEPEQALEPYRRALQEYADAHGLDRGDGPRLEEA